jgi:tetratricopeptide (TPR) repeat protein
MPGPSCHNAPAAVSGKLTTACAALLLGLSLGSPCARAQLAAATPAASERPFVRDESEARRTTMARALFEEGLRFVDAGRWAEAEDRFERVLLLRYSPVAAYNLGLAQARLGHGVVAAATFRKLLADPTLEPKVREPATAQLSEVEAHFGWLTLHVPGRCEGCQVQIDREDWPPAVWGVAVPIDAGPHALELRRAESILAIAQIDIKPAARMEATLAPRAAAARGERSTGEGLPPGAASLATAPASSSANAPLLTSPWFWGAMGVLVVGSVTAVLVAAR